MTIHPIRTATDHRKALAEIRHLWDAKPGTDDFDRLDVLATLVEAYERNHHPIEKPNAVAAMLFRLEQLGLTKSALEPLIGSRARVYEVLKGQRSLSIEMIRKLNETLQIPAEVLIARPRKSRARAPGKPVHGHKKNKSSALRAARVAPRRA
jgi:HTH-type transcriptional regulator / antitoxin HigA